MTRCASTWVLPEPALAATQAETSGSETSGCTRQHGGGMIVGVSFAAVRVLLVVSPPVADHSFTRAR